MAWSAYCSVRRGLPTWRTPTPGRLKIERLRDWPRKSCVALPRGWLPATRHKRLRDLHTEIVWETRWTTHRLFGILLDFLLVHFRDGLTDLLSGELTIESLKYCCESLRRNGFKSEKDRHGMLGTPECINTVKLSSGSGRFAFCNRKY